MTDAEAVDHIWELMEDISFCMLSNWDGKRLHSRPMGSFVRRDDNAIYLFTDVRAHKDDEIERFPHVCLAFSDHSDRNYVSLSGDAQIIADRTKIRELWSVPSKVWWKNPDNPNLRLIKVTPTDAEFWDAPGDILSGLRVLFALARGTYPDHSGEHRKVLL